MAVREKTWHEIRVDNLVDALKELRAEKPKSLVHAHRLAWAIYWSIIDLEADTWHSASVCPTCRDTSHPHGGPECPDCGRP